MPSIILKCPHCGAEKIGFELTLEYRATKAPPYTPRFLEMLLCSGCEGGLIAIFHGATNTPYSSPKSCPTDPIAIGWKLVDVCPKPQIPQCPQHTPDDLKRIFLQAMNALRRGDADASGAMSRKVMDASTQRLVATLLPEKNDELKNIYARIEALAAARKLTPDLKDWAHQLRLGGADAAHDIDAFKLEEASELLDFAELYLTYVYTLPGRLKERRERSAQEKAKQPTA